MNPIIIIEGLFQLGLGIYRTLGPEAQAEVGDRLRAMLAKADATPSAASAHQAIHERHLERIRAEGRDTDPAPPEGA